MTDSSDSVPPAGAPAIPGPAAARGAGNAGRPSLWLAPAGILLGFALGAVGTAVVDGVAAANGGSVTHPGPVTSIVGDIVFDLCFVVAAVGLLAGRGRLRSAGFGYRRIRLRTGIGVVVVAAVVYYGLSAVYSTLFGLSGNEKLPSELGSGHGATLVAAGLFVCVIAPMAEELFFRGFLFGVLRGIPARVAGHDLGPWIAALITGILFGLAHTGSASSQYLIPLGFLGFVLCLVRWRTGSLYPCMALHSANNALALGVNQLHWGVGAILGLIAASWLVVGAVTGPLSSSRHHGAPAVSGP